jgi:exodeoxyribonuclease V beta subunit
LRNGRGPFRVAPRAAPGRALSIRWASKPRVLRDVRLDGNTVIEASAGTGKTFTLEHLVVDFLLTTEATLEQLLVVTFTEKATHEIRARVRDKLESLLSGRNGVVQEAPSGLDHWMIDDVARARLARALRAFDGATITTIHAFCQQITRHHAFASGRLFDEHLVDGREAFGRALRDALRREAATDPARAVWLEAALKNGWSVLELETLLWECRLARGPLRPVFDSASLAAAMAAFSIEDASSTDLASDLKACGTHPSRAKSVCERIRGLASIVERARLSGDLPEYLRDAERIKVNVLVEQIGSLAPKPGATARVCAAALAVARRTPPFAAAVAQALLPPIERGLVRGKRETGSYDFDDMLALVDEALSGPRATALAVDLRRRWRHALVDEFQDTDETQWSIFRRVFLERGPDEGPRSMILVGDPKQSIYRFRGADIDTYVRARDEVIASGGSFVSLDKSYRATRALVEATNELFDANASEPLLSGTARYTPVACGRPDRALIDGDGRPVSPVHVLRFGAEFSAPALGAAIAREIREATEPARPWAFDGAPLQFDDIFVLTRTAREGRGIGAALREAGIPHAFYKDEGLFQSEAATDMRVLLSAIDDPDDRASRLGAWLTPFFGLPLAQIECTRSLPAGHALHARLRAWKALADARSFDRLFESILRDSGIVRRAIFSGDGARELTNTMHVVDLLLERARQGHVTLRDLASELGGLIAKTRSVPKLEGNVLRLDSERRAVQIMTVHKAKGLEAPLVFVAGGFSSGGSDDVHVYHEGGRRLAWVGSPWADVKAAVNREEREEDERLMYVALTRAKGRVVLPCVAAGGVASNLRGPYAPVNRRVAELLRVARPRLTVEDVVSPSPSPSRPEPSRAYAEPDPWHPPEALLRAEDTRASFESLRARHAGPPVVSYTKMRGIRPAAGARSRSAGGAVSAGESFEVDREPPGATLRRARTSGVFLHELLERIPIASFHVCAEFEVWRRRSEVRERVDEGMCAHRVDPDQRRHAEELVWSAFTRPVLLPTGQAIDSFAAPERVVREMGFVYPMGPADRRGGGSVAYVRGSLDLAFDHGALTYFVDWKSDSLASYAPVALDCHVRDHYGDQVKLYTLAITKLLGIRNREEHEARFGGLLYCFLRGFGPAGAGLWSLRPDWEQILQWGEELREELFA